MVMINTGLGHISAEDGLAMFQRAQSSQGPLLGIYMQLIKFDRVRAHQATKMVLANRTSYSAKIQRIAEEERAKDPLSTSVDEVLAKNPELFFDRNIFKATCRAVGMTISQTMLLCDTLHDSNAPMRQVLCALSLTMQDRFLDQYIKQFEFALATA